MYSQWQSLRRKKKENTKSTANGRLAAAISINKRQFLRMFRRRKAGQDQVVVADTAASPSSENNRSRLVAAAKRSDDNNNLRTPTIETIKKANHSYCHPYSANPPTLHGPGKQIDDLVPYPSSSDKSDLELALETGADSSTIEYLLQKSKRTRIKAPFHVEGVLDFQRAAVLEHILPYLEKLDCRPTSYTIYGLFHLLNCLQTNDSISEVKLLHLPSRLICSNECVQDALQNMLQHNETLVLARISMHQDRIEPGFHHELSIRAGNDNACFRAIYNAFLSSSSSSSSTAEELAERKSQIQVLELVDFHIQGHAFCNFLASPKMPRNLKFRRFRITGPVEKRYDYSQSAITDLTLTGCALAPECSKEVLEGISQLPSLRYLTWCAWEYIRRPFGSHYERIDMTDAVLTMLNRNVIESITSMTSSVQIPPVCVSLKTNKSLRSLRLGFNEFRSEDESLIEEVLRYHNTTLGEVARASSCQVTYFCNLNRYGRCQARDLRTTKQDFFGLIWVANESHALVTDTYKLNVLYGLLSEMPQVWCQ